MSATPEREQAEAAIALLREQFSPRDDHHARCDTRAGAACDCYNRHDLPCHEALDALAAAVYRLEAERDEAERKRDRWQASATTTCLACSEARERMHEAEDRVEVLVKRAEKAEARLDGDGPQISFGSAAAVLRREVEAREDAEAQVAVAVERERELTRALESADEFFRGDLNHERSVKARTLVAVALAGGVSAAPDEDEQAYCAECGRAGAPETLPEAYAEECPPGAPCRGVSAAGRRETCSVCGKVAGPFGATHPEFCACDQREGSTFGGGTAAVAEGVCGNDS